MDEEEITGKELLVFPEKLIINTAILLETRSPEEILNDKEYKYNIPWSLKHALHEKEAFSANVAIRFCSMGDVTVPYSVGKHARVGSVNLAPACRELLLLDALLRSENKELITVLMESLRLQKKGYCHAVPRIALSTIFRGQESGSTHLTTIQLRQERRKPGTSVSNKYFVSSMSAMRVGSVHILELKEKIPS